MTGTKTSVILILTLMMTYSTQNCLTIHLIQLRNDSYSPGDVAIIHPIASSAEVEAFLDVMNWTAVADIPFEIEHTMQGTSLISFILSFLCNDALDQSLPSHIPSISTLRTLFMRYVDINAVPRRSFFQYLRYFTNDELEQEKLDEFLSMEGAVSSHHYTWLFANVIRQGRALRLLLSSTKNRPGNPCRISTR